MKYIKKIILENFQSHKYTEIELNEKLNIIVGPSDSGKTAIIRAIKWALYNEPAGDFFIREGESEVTVSLIFSDNTQLTRYRSKTKNVYELMYNNGEELRLEGFGTGVPGEIKEAIGIYKINLDGKETNSISLAEQLEGPFLLSEKTSTRASAIGQLVGVDALDEALREVLKDLRTLNVTKKNLDEEIKLLDEEIETFDYLDKLKATITNVSKIRDVIRQSQSLFDKLNNNYKVLEKLYTEKTRLQITKDKLSKLDDIDKILNSLESIYIKYWHLSNYNKNLNKVKKDVVDNEDLVKKLENIDLSINIESELIDLVKEHKTLLNTNTQYNKIKEEMLSLNYNITSLLSYLKYEDNINKVQGDYEILIKLKNLKEKLDAVKFSIIKGNNYIQKFQFIDDILEKNKILENYIEILNKLNKLYEKKLTNAQNIQNEENSINKINLDNKEFVEDYKSILNNIEKCPLCFSEIDNNKIKHIMDHYIGG